MRVFVTGGSGFIGSHLIKRLLERGDSVLSFVHNNPGEMKHARIYGDLRDSPHEMRSALENFKPHYVFHLAAQPIVTDAMKDDLKTVSVNVAGTYNLLHACKGIQELRAFVHISTDKVYGKYLRPVKESDVLMGTDHPYNTSKMCGDVLAQMYAESFGVPTIICRSGNIYGEGDNHPNRIIPETILQTLSSLPVVVRSDGKMVRDYIYIDDIIDAYFLLAETVEKDSRWNGKAVNFGAFQPMTVLDVVHEVLMNMNRVDLYPRIENSAKTEIPYQHLDWSLAESLGWKPKTDFSTGISNTVSWHRNKRG